MGELPPIDPDDPFDMLHVEYNRIKAAIDVQLKGFDAASYVDEQLAVLFEDLPEKVTDNNSQTDAAWAWRHLQQMEAGNREACWTSLMSAQRSLAGESQSVIQGKKRVDKENWHTEPLRELCKGIRRADASLTQEGLFNALASCLDPLVDSEADQHGDIKVTLTSEDGKTHSFGLDAFKKFERKYRIYISG